MMRTQIIGAIFLSLLAFMAGRISKNSAPLKMVQVEQEERVQTATSESPAKDIVAVKSEKKNFTSAEKALLEMVNSKAGEQNNKFGEISDAAWAEEAPKIYSELNLDKPYQYTEHDGEIDILLTEPDF